MGTLLKDASDEFIDAIYATCVLLQRDQRANAPVRKQNKEKLETVTRLLGLFLS